MDKVSWRAENALMQSKVPVFIAFLLIMAITACSDGYVQFPTGKEAQGSLGDDVEVIVLSSENISDFTRPARGHQVTQLPNRRDWTYAVGAGDILSVIVFDHPELTLPAGPQRSAAESGFQVASDGTITYPYIGAIRASGRSVGQIRSDISQRLANFIPDPQVEVRIAAYNSQSIVVSGEVAAPNRQPLTSVRLSLVEAINAAGGLTDEADPRIVSVQRGGHIYHVDVLGFLQDGIEQNNPILRNGDVVNVPRRSAEEAYLLGEVARPDVVDLSREAITLTQAITRRGGLQQSRANARGVLVFRAHGDHVTRVFQLDTSSPSGLLLGTKFVLEPRDVVYVLRSPLQRWNDTIVRLLPTVQAVNTVDSVVN
ncbi:polysaccharide biosynthesis/export family protein [Roseinatronobacter alkalisoli]|uniref:Polysaccharide biosynthesis/export family protein n=1 Tax=Roseinatronobacter alkalisoli TaxID=3028235 RepID=A0ABT5TAJ2_9RHOB|nr:polysaccharide biosynthesis/export family protein [Roseinatronobacter sp. HJB301]MDD7971991.1 polysaccharide biosynthesis/export family protein [Roseinatronobacter sp. HJB301]